MEQDLRIATLSVASRSEVTNRALAAFRGETVGAHISFASVDLLWRTLTRERWALLEAMTGQAPMTADEAARRVDGDPATVRAAIEDLLQAGVLDRDGDHVVFPFDVLRVDFTLTRAA